MNKYKYYKIIQECYAGQWYDVDTHETNSQYVCKDHAAFKVNLKAYREAGNAPVRVVKRRVKLERA